MRMPTKNVYVSESDLFLFDRAAELAGGMSAAVALGLRLYVTQQDRQRKDTEMKTIELKVDDGAVVGVKRFGTSKLRPFSTFLRLLPRPKSLWMSSTRSTGCGVLSISFLFRHWVFWWTLKLSGRYWAASFAGCRKRRG